ncbi:NAD(P)/FAD-dependent oxidoreductase [Thalassobacillus devorans]|uniref:NAD(P)/FAD-dependent oxidoreductase n=1 Tax=Thalassobacillus devorans TaxID=279813 RepID=UPI000A1CA830|nr:NAD(P)/FAD-dependent oxidoreductase [Thalassobacillus devorans]
MYDVIIIGAGPAGLSAATTSANEGLNVLVIDEYMKAGGRLLGQLYEEPDGTYWNGIKESNHLYEQARRSGAEIKLRNSVHNIEKSGDVWLVYTERATYETSHLLLATGAAESPLPVPGWTLPGVMSVGAAQVMTNVHRVKPGKRGVIIGVNPLAAVIASELQMAGVEVAALTLPQMNGLNEEAANPKQVMNQLLHVAHMAPSALIRQGSKWMKPSIMQQLGITFYPKSGFKMWGIPVHLRKAVTEILGDEKVAAVKLATVKPNGDVIEGTEEIITCDFVCIAGGLYPLTELAAVAGCPFYLVEELGGYVPLHNERMETALDGLYVAGNITGIEGAKIAIAQGVTAGLTMASNHGVPGLEARIDQSIKEIEHTRDSAPFHFHPDVKKGKQIVQEKWEEMMKAEQPL